MIVPELLAEIAPKHLDKILAPNRCIAATWIGLQVLQHFEIEARHHPVRVDLLNGALVEAARSGEDLTRSDDLLTRGAWAISVDPSRPGEYRNASGWIGHLVILTADRLVDLAFGQFRRPEKGLDVPDAHALPFESFPAIFTGAGGSALVYHDDAENRGYRRAPDWTRNRPHFRRTTGAIIREISSRLTVDSLDDSQVSSS